MPESPESRRLRNYRYWQKKRASKIKELKERKCLHCGEPLEFKGLKGRMKRIYCDKNCNHNAFKERFEKETGLSYDRLYYKHFIKKKLGRTKIRQLVCSLKICRRKFFVMDNRPRKFCSRNCCRKQERLRKKSSAFFV